MQAKSEKHIRHDKLAELIKLGINPYPSVTPEHISVAQARQGQEGDPAAVVGRITSFRQHGKITFFDLAEGDSKIQLFAQLNEIGDSQYDLIKFFDVGDYLWVNGELFTTKAGELTIKVKQLQLLSKSLLPIPDSWQGLSDVETRFRQRALDFKINPAARAVLRVRAKIIQTTRDYLNQLGFTEVQTPILQPIPGGASAKPFTTHYNAFDADFYLRIAPELYLKRLIVGEMEKVYEIGPSFRNEGLSHMHNPEFTTCEFYWAYQTSTGLMTVTQAMIQTIVETVKGSLKVDYQSQPIDFSGTWPVATFTDLIKKETGIDLDQAKTFELLQAAVKATGIQLETKPTVWAELADELYKKVVRPKIIQPTFMTGHPLELSPLAKTDEHNPKVVQRFQLVLAGGFEVVNAYTELNDPIEQEQRFKEQAKMAKAGWDEAQVLDENFVEALKFGMPPTAGWGMGIDRLVMILTDNHQIKEVLPFPTLRPKK